MSYKVLYRKYRPESFDSLVGQENIVRILRNAIVNNKLSHAYIFSGPRGTGKTSSAKIFAKSVNCLSEDKEKLPCGVCVNCINADTTSDIIEIDAASNNGVDEIREIINNIKLTPNMLKYKVYIIDEVHMLSQSAFNALLLTLEEPPSHVIFILATTNIESVPITILSRCQRFDFKKITINDIENRLKYICKEENIKITDEALKEIAYLSDGGLRDSLSLLDQLSKENTEISIENVSNTVGNVSKQNLNLIIDMLEKNDTEGVINKINDLSNSSVDSKVFIKGLIETCVKRVKNIILNKDYVRLNIDEYKKLVIELTDCMNKINVNVNVFSLILVILLSYIDSKIDIKKEIISPVENLEVTKKEVSKAPTNENKDINNTKNYDVYNENRKIRMNNCFVNASKEEKIIETSIWNEIKEEIDSKLKGLIIDSEVVISSKEILTLKIERESELKLIESSHDLIEEFYVDFSKKNKKLLFVTKEEWKNYSEEYIKNLKNGIKYNYIEEISINKDELDTIANSIFDADTIERG